jgi:hypothetical protein
MGAAISLRADFDAEGLRRLARKSKHAAQARRLLALALIYGGGSRSDARATSRNRSAEYYPLRPEPLFSRPCSSRWFSICFYRRYRSL